MRFYPSAGIVPVMDLGPCSFLVLPSCAYTPSSGIVPVMDLGPRFYLEVAFMCFYPSLRYSVSERAGISSLPGGCLHVLLPQPQV